MKTAMMKVSGLAIMLMMIATCGSAQATNDEITLAQSIWGLEKRDIVTQYMKLTDAEAVGFWKEYDIYETGRKEIGKERALLVTDYVSNYDKLTDAKATELVKKISANNIAMEKLQQATFMKLTKVMSAVRAAQFIQLENYLVNTIRLAMQSNLPFIGELDKVKK